MTRVCCMGGWCHKRDNCALHMKDDRTHPVERLCAKGQADSFEPIKPTVKTWEPVQVARQEWFPQ